MYYKYPFFRELKDAALKIVMITGDNMLTGISVARDSRIIDPAGTKIFS